MTISQIFFGTGARRSPISAHDNVAMKAISDGKHWKGVRIEIGSVDGSNGEDMMVDGHLIAMNVGESPFSIEVRDESRNSWTTYVRSPGTFLIHPEGSPVSIRHSGLAHWSAAVVDGSFLDSLAGCHFELRAGMAVTDPFLEHIFRALTEAVLNKTARDKVVELLVNSFVMTLAHRHGHSAPALPAGTGLDRDQMDRLLTWIEASLGERITSSTISKYMETSSSHLSREFKRSTGKTLWGYVIERRLERARLMLESGESATTTALHCGFFDQAHLTRLFKQHYNLPPVAFAKKLAPQMQNR